MRAARLPSKASVNPLAVKLALMVCLMIAIGTAQSIPTISEEPKCNDYSEIDGNMVPRALESEEQSTGVSLIGRSQVNVFLHVIAYSDDKKGGVISVCGEVVLFSPAAHTKFLVRRTRHCQPRWTSSTRVMLPPG